MNNVQGKQKVLRQGKKGGEWVSTFCTSLGNPAVLNLLFPHSSEM